MDIPNEQNTFFKKFKTSSTYQAFAKAPVAYFCAEYALESAFPTYAGGLGILSGDYIREVALQGFPLLAVGLRYQQGQNTLSNTPEQNLKKLKKVVDKNNQDLVVSVPIEHRIVNIKVWQWEEDNIKLFLLDTDIEENILQDREITKCLYDENRDIRLKQEIVLGIGGFRVLAVLGYHASVYHLNEGHSAFLALELIRHEMEHQQVDFWEACKYAKKHILFTNHTLALAGQEQFLSEKVESFVDLCTKDICLNKKEISALGSLPDNPNLFSMTTFSFGLSEKANAVSQLHYENAKLVWPKQAMDVVTNGIFIDRWDTLKNASEANIWSKHLENKKKLLTQVHEKTGEVWGENDLIFVWARRLVEYKQPLFFFKDVEKFIEIVKNSEVPVRVIFAGPSGHNENPFQTEIEKLINEKLRGTVVFLSGYNMDLAKILTSGADIWLNTPIMGMEACGTSGMKAGLNGVLSLSTNDGWINEINHEDIGWVTSDSENNQEMLKLFKEEIIPTYFSHLQNPANSVWVKKMMRARNLIFANFSTTRMLKEYIEKFYIPILEHKHAHKID
ncbi:MAG: alpha-glucan family phosphorylase [Candidatus Pacebacteria bacterium]|nr:alpha-glucan family phosphorylase [Candidatus Paceibacterota bacterium]